MCRKPNFFYVHGEYLVEKVEPKFVLNKHFDLVKELLNNLVTIMKSSIIHLFPNHIHGYTKHRSIYKKKHSISFMHTIS